MSISRTVSDLTGKIQSAGVEKQPGRGAFEVQSAQAHECRLLLRSGGPRLQSCSRCNRAGRRGSSMLGFYPAVAKLRAYFLRPVGSAAREKACWRWWQIPWRFARTEQARDKGRERKLPTVDSIGRATPGGGRKAQFGLLQKVHAKRAKIRGQRSKLAIRR